MIQLHRRFLSASSVPSSSSSSSSSSSALRLRPLMAKLQCRALHNYRETCLPCSPFLTSEKHSKSSLIRLKKVRFSYKVSSQAKAGVGNLFGPINSVSYGCINMGSSFSIPTYGGFTRRFNSRVQALASKTNSKSVQDSGTSSSEAIDLEASGKLATSSSTSLTVGSDKGVSVKKKPRAKKSPKQKDDVVSSLKANLAQGAEEIVQDSKLKLIAKVSKKKADGSSSLKKPVHGKKSGSSNLKGDTATAQKVEIVQRLGKVSFKPLYPPVGRSVVVVESATKAKVIQRYLGDMYEVLPSYGHVRDLAGRSGSVLPDDDFSMVWEVPSAAWTHLKSIKVALSGAQNLILASDPDREGEAIAWHIIEMLQQQDAFQKGMTIARVVFHEITESSIKKALTEPRVIDANLIHAYLARRALDYLIGFSISPLLWRKLPGCQSAGRVQSAALTLVCDRETEIEHFNQQEYWTVAVEFGKKKKGLDTSLTSFPAHLTHYDSTRLNQLSISSQTEGKEIENKVNSEDFKVVGFKTTRVKKNPPTPYITSTLQQDAATKLHFTATHTMKVSQKLYEGVQLSDGEATGLITYMRTDGQHISDEALGAIRSFVAERYGIDFAAKGPMKKYKKVKNAQEAHEAIRPTDISRLPSMLNGILDKDSLKVYTLIWCRTVACQMEPAISKQLQIDVGNASKSIIFRSSCSTTEFHGHQAAFKDVEAEAIGYNQKEGNDLEGVSSILSSLKTGDRVSLGEVFLKQHHTQPPPRYSEASLVKKMEELGIGRPSTYASTLKVLQDRNYVTMKSRVLHPEFRGRMVSAFLNHHFTEVTNYGFTADMETELDNVSAGLTEWKGFVKNYWTRFSAYCKSASSVHIHEVEKMLESKFEDILFASLPDRNRICPSCSEGTLTFKVSRYGSGYFIGCDQHPACKYIATTLNSDDEDDLNPQATFNMDEPKVIGLYPGSGEKIFLKSGPYGFYVQLGEDKKNGVPKRASVSHIKDLASITVEVAAEVLRYPVMLGDHPDDRLPVLLKMTKTGLVVSHRRASAPIPKTVEANEVDLEKALKYLSGAKIRTFGRKKNSPNTEAVEATV